METLWKVLSSLVVLFFFGLCNGLPINLENSGPDPHTQFLTGLVAVLLTVCSVVLLAGCLCCQRQSGFKEFRDSPVASSATIISSNLDHGHVNPIANSSSEFTIFTPISPPHHNNNVFLANQRIVSCNQEDYKDGDIDASSWFDGSEKDFPRTKLKYIRELGKGWFGRVVEGTAQNISDDSSDPEWTPVVVRILEASATSREKLLFLNDATIYKCGYHPNILGILGRSLDTVPLLLLQEYCPQGDLKKYLRTCKSSQDKLVAEDMPLRWCYQLTLAIKFLHDQKLTHPDLAARNCQLSEDLSLKLGDYGLSASYYPEDYYQGSPGVPLRWCAPEIISYTSTTIQTTPTTAGSNVWALGITMWEILEWGKQPFAGLTDDEVISQVLGTPKVRLSRPTYHLIYTDYMYKIMQSCWYNAESRVTVSQIELMMADLMHVYEHTKISLEMNSDISNDAEPISLQDFDTRWNALKPYSPVPEDNVLQLQPVGNHQKQDRGQKSASLNNLHGSLDNLLDTRPFDRMESWLENVASDTSDLSFVRGLSEAITDLDNAIAMENMSSSPEFGKSKLIVGCQITSSESETEDENWRKKIERGAYTEKVRQKSRSVADLMVLTHIDYSESDSETLPSLDFKVNQRVRYLKNGDNQKKFGSEGNLLHVNDNAFQEELKKLQEERRDSLLFVPDKFSESSFSGQGVVATTSVITPTSISNSRVDSLENSPVKKLMEKLNSPSEMVPPQRVYNVFNVRVQHNMNVGGTVCDKMSENIGQIYLDASAGDILEKGTISEDICDRHLESKVLEQNAIISQNNGSENQINPFSVYTINQNIEEGESTNHIKTVNRPVSEPFLNVSASNSFYCKYVNNKQDENTVSSRNYEIHETPETYPFKKDDKNAICKINGANAEIKVNYRKMSIENNVCDSKLNPNETLNEVLSSRKKLSENSTGITSSKFYPSNESLTRSDSPKENNFDIKIEILNEQNSTLNENIQKNYDINVSKKLSNDFFPKENTPNENSKNVKLKVPKLSEMIQRNAIDYKVHNHHGSTKEKTSVISKSEDNDKSIHQEVVDKDSGLNTPENSASLEKLYDDNEEILDVGSFDSDRSNEAPNKGNLLNEEDHIVKEKTEELSVISYFENQKEFDREEEILNLIDFCASKESRLICDLFLANEKANYFAGFAEFKTDQKQNITDYNPEDNSSKEIPIEASANTDIFSDDSIQTNDKEYPFLNSGYVANTQTFIQSKICHSSNSIKTPILSTLNEDTPQVNIEGDKTFETFLSTNRFVDNTEISRQLASDTNPNSINSSHYTFNVNLSEVPDVNLKNESKSMEEDQKTTSVNDFFLNKVEGNIYMDKKEENYELCDGTGGSIHTTDAKIRNTDTKSFEKTDLLQEKGSALSINNYYVNSNSNVNELANETFVENVNTNQDNLPKFSYAENKCDNIQVNQSSLLIDDHIFSGELCSKTFEGAIMCENIENNITSIIQDAIRMVDDINLTTSENDFQNEHVKCVNMPAEVGLIVSKCKPSENENLELFVNSKIIDTKSEFINNKTSNNSQTDNVDNSEIHRITLQNFDKVPKEPNNINLIKNVLPYSTSQDISSNSDKIDCKSDVLNKTKTFLNIEIENYIEQAKNNVKSHMDQNKINCTTHFNEDIAELHCNDTFEHLEETLPLTEATNNQILEGINNLKHIPGEITSVCDDSSENNIQRLEVSNESFSQTEKVIEKDIVNKSEMPRIKDKEDSLVLESEIDITNKNDVSRNMIDNIDLKYPKSSDDSELSITGEEKHDFSNCTTDLNADVLKYVQNDDSCDKYKQNLEKSSDKQCIINTNDLSTFDNYLNINVQDPIVSETYTFLRNEIINYEHGMPTTAQNTYKIGEINNTLICEDEMQLIDKYLAISETDKAIIKCSGSEICNEISNKITNKGNGNEEQFYDQQNQNLSEAKQADEEYQMMDDVQSDIFTQEDIDNLCNYSDSTISNNIIQTAKFLNHEVENYNNSERNYILPTQDVDTKLNTNQEYFLYTRINECTLPEELSGILDDFNSSKCYSEKANNENDPQDTHNDQNLLDLKNKTEEVNRTDTTNPTFENIVKNEKSNDNSERRYILPSQDIDTKLNTDQEYLLCNNESTPSEELSGILDDFNSSKCYSKKANNEDGIQDIHNAQNLLDFKNKTEEANRNDTTYPTLENIIPNEKSNDTQQTSIFLKNEIENYIGAERRVDFDLSDTQDKMSLNSLTHLSAFTSTPFANRRPNESNTVILGASDDYSIDYYSGLKTSVDPEENPDLQFSSNFVRQNNNNDLYSLETWDNFLGRSFDEQENAAIDFSDFSQEPHSLLFLECDADNCGQRNDLKMTKILNETYDAGVVPATDGTFVKEYKPEAANLTVVIDNMDKVDEKNETDPWKKNVNSTNSGGWFLHPQCAPKESTGPIETNPDAPVPSTSDESYVGFSMDDEIMAAIRNELLTKLPHAQRASSDHQIEENCEEMDSAERNEVFLRYNVYNTPLSPIPEESYDSEFGSGQITPKRINDTSDDEGDSSDWSVQEDNNSSNTHTEEITSPRVPESPARCRTDHCRHTPSQDSCCSNDTLFNIEDLNGGINDRVLVDMALHLPTPLENILDSMEDEASDSRYDDCNAEAYVIENDRTIQNDISQGKEEKHMEVPIIRTDHDYILEFLDNERYNEMNLNFDAGDEISSASDIYLTVSDNTFSFGQNVAPLNSPEDRPWKELQASFRKCDEDQLSKISSSTEKDAQIIDNDSANTVDSLVPDQKNPSELFCKDEDPDSKTICRSSFVHEFGDGEETDDCFISDEDIDKVLREELESETNEQETDQNPEDVAIVNNNGVYNDERIYVNLTKTESGDSFNTDNSSCDSPTNNIDKMMVEYENLKGNTCEEEPVDIRVEEVDDGEDKFSRFEDLFGPLTDIRFSGPGSSSQLMTTSFSESNDFGDDQDWDSGSDTRSSSSGEFIWKEGEHEASVKALRAPPQLENVDYVTQMENIQEEQVSVDSSKENSCASSTSSGSEGEDECPEFVPSAWDKYATPTKSALRSPEKTLERNKEKKPQDQHTPKEKKSKGVWFKKQKYHCVYEYPREPESPILQSYDLWKPTPDYATLSDWDLDANTYLPTALTEPESSFETQTKHDNLPKNLYSLSAFSDNIDPTSLDEDFFVSSSSKPFDMLTGLTSQFFPGRQYPGETWTDAINITPDSGVEDIPTPATFVNTNVSSCDDKDGINLHVTEVQSLKILAANAAERSGRRRELGGLRHTRNKLKLDLPPSPSAFTSNRTFSVDSVADEIVSRQVPTFTTFGKSRFLVQHVDTPPDSGRSDKNVSFEALPHKKPEPFFIDTNDWKHQKKDKQKIESVRGEASLLDSTDEDSGIESCTLDRKRFNV